MLLTVVAVLILSYASSLRAYLQQRDQIRSLRSQVADYESNIAALKREKSRWKDPAYVEAQARERLLYVMPGEVGFQVIGADGKPLDPVDTLSTPAQDNPGTNQQWWQNAWQSVVIAGRPTDSVLGGAN